jgi:hypothetical protein
MKVTIDLGTADIEMQRSDGSWEKVEHCRTRVTVDGAVLKIDLAAVLTGEPLKEAKDSVGRASIITNAVPLPRSERPAPPSPPGPRSVSGTPPKTSLLDGKSPVVVKPEHLLPPMVAVPRKRFWWF